MACSLLTTSSQSCQAFEHSGSLRVLGHSRTQMLDPAADGASIQTFALK
jgi:hypothetical protein